VKGSTPCEWDRVEARRRILLGVSLLTYLSSPYLSNWALSLLWRLPIDYG